MIKFVNRPFYPKSLPREQACITLVEMSPVGVSLLSFQPIMAVNYNVSLKLRSIFIKVINVSIFYR